MEDEYNWVNNYMNKMNMRNYYYNDAQSFICKAEIELEDWRDETKDEVTKWKLNFIRNQLSNIYNKLTEIREYEIRTIQTQQND